MFCFIQSRHGVTQLGWICGVRFRIVPAALYGATKSSLWLCLARDFCSYPSPSPRSPLELVYCSTVGHQSNYCILNQSSQPTTTLQALVNLKRPTLRLSPLSSAQEEANPHAADQHHHGLEFEYDCDAPKCGIYVHVYLPKSHPDAPVTATQNLLSKLLVFETVVDGGFGNHLTLEEGALLELGRFEHCHGHDSGADSSHELPAVGEATSSGDLVGTPSNETGQHGRNNQRRRFTHFHFRKRAHNHSISGPALAVVDAEPAVPQEGGKAKDVKQDAEEGVKVTIRLAALDEQGTELASPNEQITYLDIVRFGQKIVAEGDSSEPAEDTRPWVVKVVKREATVCFSLCGKEKSANKYIVPLDRSAHFPLARDLRAHLGLQQDSCADCSPSYSGPHIPAGRRPSSSRSSS